MKAILRAGALLAVAIAAGSCTNLLGTFDLVCDTPCGAPSDCPDPMSPCVERTCTNGCCGTADLPDMTSAAQQMPGTCERVVCDGMGNTQTLADDTNPPAGADACHAGGCLDGVPTQVDRAGACSANGGKVCGSVGGAAAGTCVACNVTADCTGSTVCLANTCAPMSCMDLVKDGTETDVDCGGPSCPRCTTGKVCLVATDCTSGVCTAGVCLAPSCTDGVKNGTETDVDCGGGAGCPPCAYGDKCLVATDCASTFCVTDKCGASVLATGQVGARGIALDASTVATVHSVYWTDDASAGTVRRVLADGSAPSVSLANQPNPTGVAVATTTADGAYLVWTNGAVTSGTVQQATIGTAVGPVVTPVASGLMAAGAIVADTANAYWVTAGALMQAPIGTAATGANAVVREKVTSPVGIGVHGAGDIYWTSGVPATGSVNKLAAGATSSTTLAAGQDTPGALAVDHLNVYWCNDVASTGSVMRLQLSPLGAPVAVATGLDQPIAIAVDATYVYWATTPSGAGTVSKAPISGTGATVTLVSGETSIAGIAVDSTFVYWTNPFDGTVKRVHK